MTTTDPTPLAEQIAREHSYLEEVDECSCGQDHSMSHALHIAAVTEWAVRDRVAAEIEAAKSSHAFRNAILDRAARIARGDTDA